MGGSLTVSDLPFIVPYNAIKRGNIYLAGIPFDDGRPLNFLETDPDGSLKVKIKDYGFDSVPDRYGRPMSQDVAVVVPHRAKYAVVLQSDELNIDPAWHYTLIAPIDSVGKQELARPIIRRAIKTNDVDRIHYITCTGMGATVEITKIRRSHKNLIFRPTGWTIPSADLDHIMVKLATILKIEKIPACTECEMNCENCELKQASSL